MNEWLIAATICAAAIAPLAWRARADAQPIGGVVALQLAGTIAAIALLLLAEGVRRQSFAELAVVMAVLAGIGTLTFLRYLERRR